MAMPSARYRRERVPMWVRALGATVDRIDRDLAALRSPGSTD
ncbi:hypothetical protein WIS52_25910 [Pseudonocardia nematodicida]|uniref:Uncharacterized protein n=1 Tax=Pseudonocardia nematodicida TaxID=1206997 RepID=A0ABV1KJ14_9PSEU